MSSILSRITESISSFYNTTILSFFKRLFSTPHTLLFLGIENAGKTTLVHKLKTGQTGAFKPTRHPKQEEVEIGKLKCFVQDMGGHEAARLLWKEYFFSCDGVVFIIDCAAKESFNTVKEVLNEVKEMAVKNNIRLPISILMNKVDLYNYSVYNVEDDVGFCSDILYKCDISEDEKMKVFWVSVKDEDFTDEDTPVIQSFIWLEKVLI
ncbi:Small COPII coat GTPase SAR1 [Cucumispora dikerogammari]|nr:Small COPII coat GTPase SAR1 [Cucumispora dikerogammari]